MESVNAKKDVHLLNFVKNYVHAHTNILSALGIAGYIITQRPDWKDKIKGLQKIDWRRDSSIWQNKVVMDGKMLKNRLGIKRAANEILSNLGINADSRRGSSKMNTESIFKTRTLKSIYDEIRKVYLGDNRPWDSRF